MGTTREQSLMLAARAACDPRTARDFIAGENKRGAVQERLERAARELGIPRFTPPAPAQQSA